eukprot:m.52164 g.52164  ORF g.52164 m.52164 type:complete len:496 (-) comp16499_c0_seq3:108-1595(-)
MTMPTVIKQGTVGVPADSALAYRQACATVAIGAQAACVTRLQLGIGMPQGGCIRAVNVTKNIQSFSSSTPPSTPTTYGAMCICPDDSAYAVRAADASCSSAQCTNGVLASGSGACIATVPGNFADTRQSVVCAPVADVNVYRSTALSANPDAGAFIILIQANYFPNFDQFGAHGANCRCPNGLVYMVGGDLPNCAAYGCFGGVIEDPCIQRQYSRHGVVCATPSTWGPTTVPTGPPTATPTAPTMTPTARPTAVPSLPPSAVPSASPIAQPTPATTAQPTHAPTPPTASPIASPTVPPTTLLSTVSPPSNGSNSDGSGDGNGIGGLGFIIGAVSVLGGVLLVWLTVTISRRWSRSDAGGANGKLVATSNANPLFSRPSNGNWGAACLDDNTVVHGVSEQRLDSDNYVAGPKTDSEGYAVPSPAATSPSHLHLDAEKYVVVPRTTTSVYATPSCESDVPGDGPRARGQAAYPPSGVVGHSLGEYDEIAVPPPQSVA